MERIICGIATIKGREDALKETVHSIINQVDKLIVYQNGYKEIFNFLKNSKIEVYSSLDTGIDMGDAAKFYKLSEYKNDYYFSIDDDLIYPSDYVKKSLDVLKKYKNEIIVTYHGRTLIENAKSYYKDAKVKYKCLDDVSNYDFVHFGGTGVMAFHTSFVKVQFNYFKHPNMADIWVGLFARENNIPILVIPHYENWIRYSDKFDANDTIYNNHTGNSIIQDSLILNFNKKEIIKYKKTVNDKIYFLIPSFNRYDKLSNLLRQIKNETNCGVILYDDASTDERYSMFSEEFNNVKYLRGNLNNGKSKYNETIKTLFNEGLDSDGDYFILIADDFILCKSFVEKLLPFLDEFNITNVFSLRPEGWGRLGWIDGAMSLSKGGIKTLLPLIPENLKMVEGKSTGVWRIVTDYFSVTNKSRYKLIALNYSLCQHDGNDDSKLHPKHRLKTPIVANNFYDDFYGKEIKICGVSDTKILKKKQKDTSNGDEQINTNIGEEVIKPKIAVKPIVNSDISRNKEKLHIPENKNTKKTPITKISNDIMLGKLRKGNLKFGKR
jgi:hypothetical protein